jgi:hypothetical protein
MKRRINMAFTTRIGLLALAALTIIPACTLAQEKTDKKASEVRTLTGCLRKGDAAHEYALTANDGSTWEIKSTSLKLYPHVGHTVTVTGVVSHPELHKMKEDAKASSSARLSEKARIRLRNDVQRLQNVAVAPAVTKN